MWKLKNRHNNKGFTFIELMITMGIVAVLSGIGVVGLSKITATNQQTQCINNLREISQGLQFYHNDIRTFPEDGYPYDKTKDPTPLSTELASYIKVKSVFVCPADEDPASSSNYESYDPYYVARPGSYQNEELVIGCPRHSNDSSSTSMFSMGSTEVTNIGAVKATRSGVEQAISPDGTTADRAISVSGDVLEFADGSTVTLDNSAGDCFLVQSVRLADGTLYSIVRLQDNGKITVDVNQGSKFEVVTPSAIVGVRGTRFTVENFNGGYKTDVTLFDGTVILMDRITGETTTLTEGGITLASAETEMHSHPHWHAWDGTYVTDTHAALNLAHHGNPALAMKIASGAGGGGGEEPPSPEDQALIDYINTTSDSDMQIRNYLNDNSPLSDVVLLALINRVPLIDSAYNRGVFEANVPLSDTIWVAIINRGNDVLLSAAFRMVFDAHSTISDTVLNAAINKGTIMLSAAFESVLISKGPLSENVLITLANSSSIMDSSSYGYVLRQNHLITPLTDDVINAAITNGGIMNSAEYDATLVAISPLSEPVLDTMVKNNSIMTSSNYANVLVANSPLPSSILVQVTTPPLTQADYDWVIASQ
jgi:prepilin-type N-terminal cleavage/methylation domain-containing protein